VGTVGSCQSIRVFFFCSFSCSSVAGFFRAWPPFVTKEPDGTFQKKKWVFFTKNENSKQKNKTKQQNKKTTKQQNKSSKRKKKRKTKKMEYGRVYRRTKEEQALCMAKCTGGPRGPHSKSKSGTGLCCAEECGPVTMHMIDVAERDRGTVCRRVAAYYIAKATALGYAGDPDGARRAFRKFLVFARADKADNAQKAQKAQKTERASRVVVR
jgi:hypothetical protein